MARLTLLGTFYLKIHGWSSRGFVKAFHNAWKQAKRAILTLARAGTDRASGYSLLLQPKARIPNPDHSLRSQSSDAEAVMSQVHKHIHTANTLQPEHQIRTEAFIGCAR